MEIVAEMWEEFPIYKIENAFCLAQINAEKIMKCNRDYIFLEGAKGGLEYGLRKDFNDTDKENKIIDGPPLPLNHVYVPSPDRPLA